jgi:hypothetical protein
LWWRISVRKPDGTFVPLAGRSGTYDAALHDMVVKARAYMQQNPGPYSDVVALHVDRNYLQVEGASLANRRVSTKWSPGSRRRTTRRQ